MAAATLLLAGTALASICFMSRRGILAKIGEVILATGATQFGVILGARGRTMATWSPAKSR
jgi:hypothetical protein